MTQTEIQLNERCLILEKMLFALAPVYFGPETNGNQQRLMETTIGAAIFYLPHGPKYWTGKISRGALEELEKNPKTTLTKEHQYPRKIAAKELLGHFSTKESRESLLELYENKYGKYNLVTPSENKKVSQHQKEGVFAGIDDAYRNAGIELVDISAGELAKLRKRKV